MDQTTFNMKISKKMKKEVKETFNSMGLDMATATRMFYAYVINFKKFPFTPEAPMTNLQKSILEDQNGIYGHTYRNFDEFAKDLDHDH